MAHRRLSVIAPGPAGDQPLRSADGRWLLVYNGELYNDAELREELRRAGHPGPAGACDSDTVLAALQTWGAGAIPRLRGMFAIGAYDTASQELLLARDPLGVKPLYWWLRPHEVAFASDVRALMAHPEMTPEPDLVTVSSYLSSIRTTLARRSLFGGVWVVRPGECITIVLDADKLEPQPVQYHRPSRIDAAPADADTAAAELAELLKDSVEQHLRSDVPVATLISGGLDSAIVASLAKRAGAQLVGYGVGPACSESDGDLAAGREVAQALGVEFVPTLLAQGEFHERWRGMIASGGLPLSTPNEIAIAKVSERMTSDGIKVALSGEGADELLAGYEAVMDASLAFCEEGGSAAGLTGGRFQLEVASWVSPALKSQVFSDVIWSAMDEDRVLAEIYDSEFEAAQAEVGDDAVPLDAHLRFLRRINLTGLLRRLDTATMSASLEGRTPYADARVAAFAESLPMAYKFEPQTVPPGASGGAPRGKLILRRAAADLVPTSVLERPKTSFPLPLQDWMAGTGALLTESPFAQAMFRPAVIEEVAADPSAHWTLAWPMLNVAQWGDRWFC